MDQTNHDNVHAHHDTHAATRDDALDFIKGFGCMMMPIAHVPMFGLADVGYKVFLHIIGFATVCFFATAGVTAAFQARRYRLDRLILFFGALFIWGSCWNVVIHGDLDSFRYFEIFQVIAVGSLLVCFLERERPRCQSELLAIVAFILGIKISAELWFPHVDGWNYLFCDADYIPHDQVYGKSVPRFAGFPLFPWLSVFLLGVFCYRATRRTNLLGMMVSAMALLIAVALGSNPVEKWDTSFAYFSGIFLLTFFMFWWLQGGVSLEGKLARGLTHVGRHALLYFFVHVFGVGAGAVLYGVTGWVAASWLLSLSLALLAFYGIRRVKPQRLFQSAAVWWLMITTVVGLALATEWVAAQSGNDLILRNLAHLSAIVVGIVVAVNFPHVAKMTKYASSR